MTTDAALIDRSAAEAGAPVVAPAVATASLRLPDRSRRRLLERTLSVAAEAEADVLVIELAAGASLPDDAAAFDGPVLVLSDDPALAADVSLPGVLPTGAPATQIAAAVAALAEGLMVRLPLPPERPGFAPAEPARALLTPRELEILALVGDGMSNKSIARRLGISAHTVKYHLEATFAKLGVRSRAEAVSRGLRQGLLVV